MGYLTSFTIYNDGCDEILKHKEEFAEKIYKACSSNETTTFELGCHANLVICQKTRHADDTTVYVHMGNTLCEMNPYSTETINLMKRSPEFFKSMVKLMFSFVKIFGSRLFKEGYSKI